MRRRCRDEEASLAVPELVVRTFPISWHSDMPGWLVLDTHLRRGRLWTRLLVLAWISPRTSARYTAWTAWNASWSGKPFHGRSFSNGLPTASRAWSQWERAAQPTTGGARSAVTSAHRRTDRLSRWIVQLQARVGWYRTLVAVANKHARILWAILATGSVSIPRMSPPFNTEPVTVRPQYEQINSQRHVKA